MKHVSPTTTNNVQIHTNLAPDVESVPTPTTISTTTSKNKQNFHDRAIDIFVKMVETSIFLRKTLRE